MNNLNDKVKKLLEETKTWILSTCGENPNAVPIFFNALKGNEIILYDVFMKKTLENIKKNDSVALTVFDDSKLQGYQIKGTARYSTETSFVEDGNAISNKFNLTTKGALIVQAHEVYVLSPGPDNGKLI